MGCHLTITFSPVLIVPPFTTLMAVKPSSAASSANANIEVKSIAATLRPTVTSEVYSVVPAQRLFKALVLEGHNVIPKAAPKLIKNIEIIAGNGEPGTIKKINFPEGLPLNHYSQVKFVKHKVIAVDEKKFTYKYTVVEGDALLDLHEEIVYEMMLEPGIDEDTKVKHVGTYYTKPGVDIKAEDIREGEKKAAAVFKAVEDYLSANPNEFA